VLATVAAAQAGSSRRFWRERAQKIEVELTAVKRKDAEAENERRLIDQAVAAAARLRPNGLPAGVGRLVVSAIPQFHAWMVAIADTGALRIEATSPPWNARTLRLPLDAKSAIYDSFTRAARVSRLTAAPPGAPYREDRLFAQSGFSSYSCIPFESGVIVLGARAPIELKAVWLADTLVARLAPIVDAWNLRRSAQAQRDLVQNLALRLYDAVDSERARIARDLHDDQAQLMAAARIAIEAPRAKARRMLREIEQTLRARLRGLRPASLVRSTLKTALEGEIRRLSEAGIRAQLGIADRAPRLPRPLQTVCYQIAREAVSNIIRHSRAHRVELALESAGSRVRLSITDDGKGMRRRREDSARARGGGLSGLAERVELIGGRLKIESRRGRTCVAAEFPSPALSRSPKGTCCDGR
jgi:signal transduction histidine kinase